MRSCALFLVAGALAVYASILVCLSCLANSIKTQPNHRVISFPAESMGMLFVENSPPAFMNQWPVRKTGVVARGNVVVSESGIVVLATESANSDCLPRLAQLKAGSIQGLDLAGSPFNAGKIKYLSSHSGLRMLRLTGCPVGDAAVLRAVVLLPMLSEIDLSYTDVTDVGLAAVGKLHNLSVCSLHKDLLSRRGLEHLKGLKLLIYLDLGESTIADGDMATIASIDSLCILNLSKTQISDDGMKYLSGLKNLKKLDLSGTALTDDGLATLIRACPTIEELNLSGTNISNTGVRQLSALKHLRKIWLRDLLRVDDSVVPLLARMNCLADVEIQGANITASGVGMLANCLPGAEIHSRPNCACRKWSRVN